MNDSQLRRLLAERSPWRARAGWEAEDPDLRAAGRLSLDYELCQGPSSAAGMIAMPSLRRYAYSPVVMTTASSSVSPICS
jgi:hypothetical protein